MEDNKYIFKKRIRKYLRKRYKMTDDELNIYLIMKYHLDHIPSREEIIKLENIMFIL